MEGIIASLTGMSLDGKFRVTVDQLQNVVDHMRTQSIESLSMLEVIEQIAMEVKYGSTADKSWHTPEHSTATPPPPSTGGSVSNGSDFMSPSFTFQSPSKPFTPFKIDKSVKVNLEKGLSADDGPFTTNPNPDASIPAVNPQSSIPIFGNSGSDFQGVPVTTTTTAATAEGLNTGFTGFFNAARNSIPSSFDSPRESNSPSPARNEAQETTTKPSRTTPDKENTETNTQRSEHKAAADAGKAWFWGSNKSWDVPDLAEKTANMNINAPVSNTNSGASSEFVLPEATFSLGASASKSKRNKTPHKPSTLPNINQPAGPSSTMKSTEPLIFSVKEPAFTQPTSSSIPTDPGISSFAFSVNGNNKEPETVKVDKNLFPTAGDLEDDDEMSVDETFVSPMKASPFVAPQFSTNSTTTGESPPTNDGTTESEKTGNGLPVDDIAFNIGSASEHVGIRSARKGSAGTRRKDSAKKTTTRPNSAANPSASLFEKNAHEAYPDLSFPQNLESMFSKQENPTSTFSVPADSDDDETNNNDPLSGDAPPIWWSQKVNETPRPEGNDQQSAPFIQPSFKLPPGPVFGTKASPTPAASRPTSARPKEHYGEESTSPRGEEQSTAQDPNLLQLATLYSKQGKELYGIGLYERALDAYTKCLNLAPKDWTGRAIVMGNRAAVYFMMHRYMETVNDCDDALKLDPTLVKLYIRKGKSLMCMGHWNPSDQAFSRVLEYSSADFLAPRGPLHLDSDARKSFEDSIEKAKLEAKAGLRDLEKLRDSVKELIGAEASMDWQKVVKICDEILHKSNMHRAAQISKATALNELSRYEDAKSYMEEITLKAPLNIQSMYAHPRAMFPCPGTVNLSWNEIREPPSVQIDISAVKSMILCMGYELGHVYVTSLKNVKASRSCSADVMMKMVAVLGELDTSISFDDKNESWQWVVKELAKLKELISMKNSADQQFKAKNFVGALNSYTAALKLDPTARRWAAILHSNRAATQMSLGLFADAISDCNNAVTKDPEYSRAYLRRARAYRSMNKFNESVRDFRRYLCSDPVPLDFKEVQKELDEMIELKNKPETKPAPAPSSSSGASSSTRPTSASMNSNTRSSKDSFKFNNFNPFNRPEGPPDEGSRPNSARSTGDWDGKNKSTGSYSHNNTYAGYARPSRSQQQQFHQQQQQQQQQYRSQTQSSNSRFNTSWNREYGLGSSDESEEEEIKPKNYYTRSTSSSSKGAFGGNNNGSGSSSNNNSNGGSQKVPSSFSLKETDHYIVLGIDMNASEKDIKVAYRKLALQYHPDKNKDPGAEDRFKMISLAYSVLSDKASRREYDLSRPLSGRGRR